MIRITHMIKSVVNEILEDKDETDIKAHASSIITNVDDGVYRKYRSIQKPTVISALGATYNALPDQEKCDGDLLSFFDRKFSMLDELFLSVEQEWEARVGKTFKMILKAIFEHLGYPFDYQHILNSKPDFLMPSVEHYREHAVDCIVFTAKRTVRERWRQFAVEGSHGYMQFLATLDENIKTNDLDEISKNHIYVVVPEEIKQKNAGYNKSHAVITFEQFFKQFLDPAMKRWRENGVIS